MYQLVWSRGAKGTPVVIALPTVLYHLSRYLDSCPAERGVTLNEAGALMRLERDDTVVVVPICLIDMEDPLAVGVEAEG